MKQETISEITAEYYVVVSAAEVRSRPSSDPIRDVQENTEIRARPDGRALALELDSYTSYWEKDTLFLGDSSADGSKPVPQTLPSIRGYRIIRPIASGGMGTVFEAEQLYP